MEPRVSARARLDDSDSDGRRSARRSGSASGSGPGSGSGSGSGSGAGPGSGRVPLLDLAFGAAAALALPPLGSARSSRASRGPSERSDRRWDAQPRTARTDGGGGEQLALMRPAASWHAGNGGSSDAAYDYEDQGQGDDGSALMEAADPELFHAGVVEHARRLGMDPEADQQLLWIARESLVAPVPSGWYHVPANETTASYYYYEVTGESRWDHPCDDLYRQIYRQAKLSQQGSKHYDQQYRPGNGYYAANPAMGYQTSAWGEEDTTPPQASTLHTRYDAAYGDQGWSNGGYYAPYNAGSHDSGLSYTQATAYTSDHEASRGGMQQELPRIGQYTSNPARAANTAPHVVVGDESPRGEPAVQPYTLEITAPEKLLDDSEKRNHPKGKDSYNDEATNKLNQEVASLVEQLGKCNQLLEASKTDVSKLRKKNDKLLKQVETATKENADTTAFNLVMAKELGDLKAQHERRSKAAQEESVLQSLFENEKEARQDLANQLQAVSQENAELQQQLQNSQSAVKQLDHDLESLKQASKRADEQAATTSASTVSILEAELARKDNELKESQAQIQTLKQELLQLKSANTKTVESAEESRSKLREMSNQLEASHKEGSNLEESLKAAHAELDSLKKRIEEEGASHAAQLGEAEDQQRSLKRELRSNQRDLKALQSESKDKDSEVAQLRTRCEDAEARLQEQVLAVDAARQQGYREAEKAVSGLLQYCCICTRELYPSLATMIYRTARRCGSCRRKSREWPSCTPKRC